MAENFHEKSLHGETDNDFDFDLIEFEDAVDYSSVTPVNTAGKAAVEKVSSPVTLQEINEILGYVEEATRECLEKLAMSTHEDQEHEQAKTKEATKSDTCTVDYTVDDEPPPLEQISEPDTTQPEQITEPENRKSISQDVLNAPNAPTLAVKKSSEEQKKKAYWKDKINRFIMNDVWYLGTDVVIPMSIFTVMSYVTMQLSDSI